MKSIKLFMFFTLLGFLLPRSELYSSTHSYLKDSHQLERFKEISLKLVCQCGCKMLLESCNHLTCMAWSMRSIIDSLILNGYSDQFIINGFEKGFSKLTENKKIMPILANEKYNYYKKNYKNGFGTSVYSEPQTRSLTILFIVTSSFLILFFVIFFIARNKENIAPVTSGKKKNNELTKDEQELWDRLYRG